MPSQPLSYFTQFTLQPAEYPEDVRKHSYPIAANQAIQPGTVMGQVTSANASEVQTLTPGGTVSGGSITITISGVQVKINWNDTAATIQANIQTALTSAYGIATGSVTVSGGPLSSGVVTVTYAGPLANQPQPLMLATNNLTGTAPTIAVGRSTAGVANGALVPYASGNSDGSQTPVAIATRQVSTDPAGQITLGAVSTGGNHGQKFLSESCAFSGGVWNTADLIGLDANAVTTVKNFMRLVSGTVASGLGELL